MIPVSLTFVGVLALIYGSYWVLVLRPETHEQRRLQKRLVGSEPGRRRKALPLLKTQERLSSIPPLNALLEGRITAPVRTAIDQSGVPLTVGRFLLLSATLGFLAYLIAYIYTHLWWLSVAAFVAASWIPAAVVNRRRRSRIRKFEEQFPEAIELIARSLRAGHAFDAGLKMAADELPPPVGAEFRALYERQNYGAQLPESLKAFAARMPCIDARFFVTAVLTQRETGGNLSEVLDRLAGVMRERFRIKREVRVRSAHGRLTAFVLAALPPAVAVLLTLNSPTHLQILITDPLGIRMLEIGVALQLLGVLVLRKLVDINY